jgi:hypothetical protein
MMPDDNITIKRSYYDILQRSHTLFIALQECGVNNWEGYGEAMRLAFPEDDESDNADAAE